MARQDSRHRSPENGKDAECTYSSETGAVKMDRPCYQDAWGTFAKENLLWRTRNGQTLPWWSEEAMQRHPQSLPQRFQHTNRVSWEQIAQDRAKRRGLIRRVVSEYEAKRISEAEQKRVQRKARAKASPTELSCFDLCVELVLLAILEHTNRSISRM